MQAPQIWKKQPASPDSKLNNVLLCTTNSGIVLGLVFFFSPLTNELIIFVSFAKKEQDSLKKELVISLCIKQYLDLRGKKHFFENELPSP
jgi:hypothetical protein